MLSRAADTIYWMNRYIERGENIARFLDVNLQLMLDFPTRTTHQWQPLVDATGDRALFQERFGAVTPENVVVFLTFDTGNPNSILSCLRAARENARSVREIISCEMWEQVNKFYLMVNTAASAGGVTEAPHDFLTAVRAASHLYLGITDATMSYGEGWHFGQIGRLVERADKTSRILNAQYGLLSEGGSDTYTSLGEIQWSAVLKSASGFEMYRQRYGRITPLSVADFLILDREFPRAMHACVIKVEESLHAVSGLHQEGFQNAAEARVGHLRTELAGTQIQDIVGRLDDFLNTFQVHLNHVGDAIFETFFTLHADALNPVKLNQR
ncbi:MAG: alpha-E domain-containing protein [Candidatus Tectomicrobia bacterium]